jgi:hypothetical protein
LNIQRKKKLPDALDALKAPKQWSSPYKVITAPYKQVWVGRLGKGWGLLSKALYNYLSNQYRELMIVNTVFTTNVNQKQKETTQISNYICPG